MSYPAIHSVLVQLLLPVRERAVVLIWASFWVARLEVLAEHLLEVAGDGAVADADAPPLVVRLPQGAVKVPDGLVHLEGIKLCEDNLKYLNYLRIQGD